MLRYDGAMDPVRVGRMTRDIISEDALPMELIRVSHEAAAWHVLVRDTAQHEIEIAIHDTATPRELRTVLRQRLEAACP